MKRVAIIAYEDCWAMSVSLTKDFFQIVSLLEGHNGFQQGYDVRIVTHDGSPVKSAGGSEIVPDGKFTPELFDLVVIPPVVGHRIDNMPSDITHIVKYLKEHLSSDKAILCLSTAAYFLAASNYMGSNTLATHWAFARMLGNQFPNYQFVTHKSYIESQNVYTTGTLEAGIDVLLRIVAEDRDDRFSQLCATYLLVSEPSKLSPILPRYRNHTDERIFSVQDWLDTHYSENLKLLILLLLLILVSAI